MRNILFLLLFIATTVHIFAQQRVIDSLKHVLNTTNNDSIIFGSSLKIAEFYVLSKIDSSIVYIKKAASIANGRKDPLWKAHVNYTTVLYFVFGHDYASALKLASKTTDEFQEYQDPYLLALLNQALGVIYRDNNLAEKNLEYAFKTRTILDTLHYTNNLYSFHFYNSKDKLLIGTDMLLAVAYLKLNKIDSALFFAQQAYEIDVNKQIRWNFPLQRLAGIYEQKENLAAALSLYKRAFDMAMDESLIRDAVDSYNRIAVLYKKMGEMDSAVFYARTATILNKDIDHPSGAVQAGFLLSDVYEKRHQNDSALYYFKYATRAKDSLSNDENTQQLQRIVFKEDLRRQELEQQALLQHTNYRNQIKVYVALGVVIALLSIAFILWRNNRRKQRDKIKIEQAYQDLKFTQSQLIQAEKMAAILEKQRAVENVRSKISMDIHDEIGIQLTKISMLTQRIKLNFQKKKEVDSILVDKITESSKEVIGNLGEIIWTVNPKHDNLQSLLAYLRNYSIDFFEQTNIDCVIDFPEDVPATTISPDLKHNLFLVIKESLNNIIKHAEATEVKVSFQFNSETFCFEITDNGKGTDLKGRDFGNGLINMKNRMEAVDGKFEIQSEIDKGTQISLKGNFNSI